MTATEIAGDTAVASPTKAKGKAKTKSAKGTALATVALTGEVLAQGDLLQTIAHEVENLTEKDVYANLRSSIADSETAFLKLGGLFTRAMENGWFAGHKDFRAFVEEECSFSFRTAGYAVSTYKALLGAGVTWEQVKGLGWSKLKEIAPLLTSSNVDRWVAKAVKLPYLQLVEVVRAEKARQAGDKEGAKVQKVAPKLFKLHGDQKELLDKALAKAKEATGSDVDAVALEAMALDYLAGPSVTDTVKSAKAKAALDNAPLTDEQLKAALKARGAYAAFQLLIGVDGVWPMIEVDIEPRSIPESERAAFDL